MATSGDHDLLSSRAVVVHTQSTHFHGVFSAGGSLRRRLLHGSFCLFLLVEALHED